MKMTYHNHDMEDYIDYHDIRYILHITKAFCNLQKLHVMEVASCLVRLSVSKLTETFIP